MKKSPPNPPTVVFTHAVDDPERPDPYTISATRAGLQIVHLPLIETVSIALDQAAATPPNLLGLIVTTKRAVQFGLTQITARDVPVFAQSGAVAQAAQRLGFDVTECGSSEIEIGERIISNAAVRWPLGFLCAERTTGSMEDICGAADKPLRIMPCYKTTARKPGNELTGVQPACFVFASPSAVRSATEHIDANILRTAQRIAIGPTTASTLEDAGLTCTIAAHPAPDGIVAAIKTALSLN